MGPASGSRGPGAERDRGQTTLDFLIGIGVFLATVGFVALFAMDAVTPFVDDQSGGLVVERTADDLVGVTLARPEGTNALDESCTLAFFDDTASDAGCVFQGQDPLEYTLDGIPDRWDIQVTIERNDPAAGQEILCADAEGSPQSCTMGGTKLAAGDSPDFGSDAVVTTTRVAMLDGRDVAVVVRLW